MFGCEEKKGVSNVPIAQISIPIDIDKIKRQIQEKIDEAYREVLFTWDIDEMSKRMCMSRSSLETDFLKDDRMRKLQRQKEKGKRYWFYEPSLKVIKEIMDEW